ncbi:MAG: ABC transporter ATP-binding protein/permease, partial [Lachnospiraceae bacterium]|nr:ABC transporter ATP-binding protein/permease [Lachnospiraceae bacterium]
YTSILVRLIKNIAKIIGLTGVLVYFSVKLAAVSFALIPLIVVITLFFKRASKTIYRITRTKLTAINTYLSEHISGMKAIQIFDREPEKSKEFDERADNYFDASYREMLIFAVFRPAMYLLSTGALCLVLGYGGFSVLNMSITVGTLYIFTNYIGSLFEPIQELAEQFGTLQQAFASAEKIFTILDEEPTVKNPENPVTPDKIKGRIVFDHVWFAYNNEDWVLKDVSFTIEPGQKVAFVGATGAGKTSVLSLIGRYYDIQKGSITIDGIDIRELNKDTLRSAIGQVQQDVFLFTGDIRSNIRLKNENITDDDIKAAAKYVNAAGFIEKLERGYDEPVTERGTTLSAGQRQLISFARTLAYDPAILVMDEATANIDTETEVLIQDALEKLMKGRTTIMVAHRLSTIQHADKIIVLHKGEIRESGKHQELLAANGIYKKLYELQLASNRNK